MKTVQPCQPDACLACWASFSVLVYALKVAILALILRVGLCQSIKLGYACLVLIVICHKAIPGFVALRKNQVYPTALLSYPLNQMPAASHLG